MANESPTSPQLRHESCRLSEGRMTACPPDQRRPLRRVSDEEVSIAQHVSHDTAVDDRPSWRAADLGAPLVRPATQKCHTLVYCPVDDTLFEVSPEIGCSGVLSRYCCYGNHTHAGDEPSEKRFTLVNRELNNVSFSIAKHY